MPRKPRIVDRTPPAQDDPVATMMAMLLPIHSAVTLEWLADATATAAERTIGAAHTFVYFEEPDGYSHLAIAFIGPATAVGATRHRCVRRAAALERRIDPGRHRRLPRHWTADNQSSPVRRNCSVS